MPELSIEQQYQNFHLELLQQFIQQTEQQVPFCQKKDDLSPEDSAFLQQLTALPAQSGEPFNLQGQVLLCKVVSAYPHLMPLVPRDLLWFFGGDCLQFMPDDEIAHFQILDEKRHEATESGEKFSYKDERAKQFGLH